MTINDNQAAAQAALTGQQDCVTEMVNTFKKRHDFVIQTLQTIKGIKVIPSDGTFYSFPNVQPIIDRLDHIHSDIELSEYFLKEAEIALVPGTPFGTPGAIRISFATSMENLEIALKRIKNLLT